MGLMLRSSSGGGCGSLCPECIASQIVASTGPIGNTTWAAARQQRRRPAYSAESFEVPVGDELTLGDMLGDTDTNLDKVDMHESLRPLLNRLPPREQRILQLRGYSPSCGRRCSAKGERQPAFPNRLPAPHGVATIRTDRIRTGRQRLARPVAGGEAMSDGLDSNTAAGEFWPLEEQQPVVYDETAEGPTGEPPETWDPFVHDEQNEADPAVLFTDREPKEG
jgi:hypothetical protein